MQRDALLGSNVVSYTSVVLLKILVLIVSILCQLSVATSCVLRHNLSLFYRWLRMK